MAHALPMPYSTPIPCHLAHSRHSPLRLLLLLLLLLWLQEYSLAGQQYVLAKEKDKALEVSVPSRTLPRSRSLIAHLITIHKPHAPAAQPSPSALAWPFLERVAVHYGPAGCERHTIDVANGCGPRSLDLSCQIAPEDARTQFVQPSPTTISRAWLTLIPRPSSRRPRRMRSGACPSGRRPRRTRMRLMRQEISRSTHSGRLSSHRRLVCA
jgi:hypothetical protein